jgi:hypothetical protein|eukprot:COSAG02_NODE_7268_length_3089_cov_85.224592_2_plen_182_part_00
MLVGCRRQHWGAGNVVDNCIMANLAAPADASNPGSSIDTWNGGGYFHGDWFNSFNFTRNIVYITQGSLFSNVGYPECGFRPTFATVLAAAWICANFCPIVLGPAGVGTPTARSIATSTTVQIQAAHRSISHPPGLAVARESASAQRHGKRLAKTGTVSSVWIHCLSIRHRWTFVCERTALR